MNKKLKKPPKILSFILKKTLPRGDREFLYNDFEMIYSDKVRSSGRFKGWIWLWGQVFKTCPAFFIHSITRSADMNKNYLKIAFRNIKRQKGYSYINIGGLAVGIACFTLIGLWIQDELNYDKFNTNYERIANRLF